MTETLRFYRKPEVTIQQSRINFLGFLLPPFNLICNLTRKGKIDESIRVVGSVYRYSDYHNRIVTQREGEDVSRRRSARRRDRSRCSLKFRVIVKRNAEGGRGL